MEDRPNPTPEAQSEEVQDRTVKARGAEKVPQEAENIEHSTRRVMRIKVKERWEKFGV